MFSTILSPIIATVAFIVILSFLVIIHELGHFFTAIWMKVKIEEFGIGYPPLAKVLFHWRGIPFTLNWLPFGGFVRMEGEEGPEGEGRRTENGELETKNEKRKSNNERRSKHPFQDSFEPFYQKSKRARLVVLLAGVFMNFLFGILAFSIVYTVRGFPRLIDHRLIDQVAQNSPAQAAGLQVGDQVIAAGLPGSSDSKKTIETTDQFVEFVGQHVGETIQIVIQRGDTQQDVEAFLRPKDQRPDDEGALGIGFAAPDVVFDFYPWWQMPFRATVVGTQESFALSMQILDTFKNMLTGAFRGQVPQDLAGPIGIVHQATKVGFFQSSWDVILKFSGMLSINLAVLNLLPIPALDGGRAFFVLTESVIGRKRREQIESRANYAGFVALIFLIIIISLRDSWSVLTDVLKYFRG